MAEEIANLEGMIRALEAKLQEVELENAALRVKLASYEEKLAGDERRAKLVPSPFYV